MLGGVGLAPNKCSLIIFQVAQWLESAVNKLPLCRCHHGVGLQSTVVWALNALWIWLAAVVALVDNSQLLLTSENN